MSTHQKFNGRVGSNVDKATLDKLALIAHSITMSAYIRNPTRLSLSEVNLATPMFFVFPAANNFQDYVKDFLCAYLGNLKRSEIHINGFRAEYAEKDGVQGHKVSILFLNKNKHEILEIFRPTDAASIDYSIYYREDWQVNGKQKKKINEFIDKRPLVESEMNDVVRFKVFSDDGKPIAISWLYDGKTYSYSVEKGFLVNGELPEDGNDLFNFTNAVSTAKTNELSFLDTAELSSFVTKMQQDLTNLVVYGHDTALAKKMAIEKQRKSN